MRCEGTTCCLLRSLVRLPPLHVKSKISGSSQNWKCNSLMNQINISQYCQSNQAMNETASG